MNNICFFLKKFHLEVYTSLPNPPSGYWWGINRKFQGEPLRIYKVKYKWLLLGNLLLEWLKQWAFLYWREMELRNFYPTVNWTHFTFLLCSGASHETDLACVSSLAPENITSRKIQGQSSPFLQWQRSNLGVVGFLPPLKPWQKATQLLKRPWSPGTSYSESEIGKLHLSDQPWEIRRPTKDSGCPRTQNMSGGGILPLPTWGLQTLSKELYPHSQKKTNG